VGRELFDDDEAERPTVTIERDELRSLIDQSTDTLAVHRAHTVPRRRPPMRDDRLDTDLSPPLSPLLVLGVVALLITVFVAVTQLH
jgi:hypothetical protein